MAKKRYYEEGRGRSSEGSSHVGHAKNSFNDSRHSDKNGPLKGEFRGPLTSAELYAGMEPRRRQELEDAGMIHEDHRAIANLPQEVMIKAYPLTGPYLPEILEDSILGVDAQMERDDLQRRKHFYPKKTS